MADHNKKIIDINNLTVKQAVKIVYLSQPETFLMVKMIAQVKNLLDRPHVYDSTITKMLRVLRQEDKKHFDYVVLDRKKSLYKKNCAGQWVFMFDEKN